MLTYMIKSILLIVIKMYVTQQKTRITKETREIKLVLFTIHQ